MPPLTWPETAPIAAPGAAADGQRAEDPDGREQRRDRARREPPAEPVRGAVAGRLLVLLDDLDLAVLVLRRSRRRRSRARLLTS